MRELLINDVNYNSDLILHLDTTTATATATATTQ